MRLDEGLPHPHSRGDEVISTSKQNWEPSGDQWVRKRGRSQRHRLPVRHFHFNLTQQFHHLLRCVPLPSCYRPLPEAQLKQLVEKMPGTPQLS
jgi:hypothetical protein